MLLFRQFLSELDDTLTLSWILGMSYSTCLIGLVYESRSTCLNLMAEITMAKQLLASEPCRLPACNAFSRHFIKQHRFSTFTLISSRLHYITHTTCMSQSLRCLSKFPTHVCWSDNVRFGHSHLLLNIGEFQLVILVPILTTSPSQRNGHL